MSGSLASGSHTCVMEGRRAGWVSHGRGGAVLGVVEQARHEHMSDKFKKQYIIDMPRSPSQLPNTRDTTMVPSELIIGEGVKRMNRPPKYVS